MKRAKRNWHQTELGKSCDICEEEGELVGQEFPFRHGTIQQRIHMKVTL
ncbi:MAG: hypothetical protein MK102_09845 [Fuerstiella sp.]|nr:hypothetical protein [Fuerstiella sp.]